MPSVAMQTFVLSNIQLFENKDISALYDKAHSSEFIDEPQLTQLFFELDINPLMYTKVVPRNYLRESFGFNSVIIPSNITEIESCAFFFCEDLHTVMFPNSNVDHIGSRAFSQTSLEQVILPESLKTIDAKAFTHCSKLKNFVIQTGVEAMATNMFHGCTNLKELTYTGTKAQWQQIELAKGFLMGSFVKQIQCSDGAIFIS